MYPQQNYGGGPPQDWQRQGADKKLAAGLCGILLGGFGVHKFILGYQQEGAIMLTVQIVSLALTFITCGIAGIVTIPLSMAISIIGLVEGIIYLTKSDEDFVRNYIFTKKSWF